MNFQNFSPYQVLMVAEKPSIARTIAYALSPQVHTERKKTKHEVHYFPHLFFQVPCLIKVTSVVGHIFSTDFTPEYNGSDVDPGTLFDAPTIKKFSSPSESILRHLQQEAQGCNYLVLWLDNDREGENICFEVIQVCDSFMNVIDRKNQYIFRAKFSSITQTEIQNAYLNLVSPDLNQSLAVDARQILDLKLGLSFSKFQTRYLQNKYNIQGKKKISYGPCQTPTLSFCVERHDEIQKFVPTTFYTLALKIKNGVEAEWAKGETFNIEEAQKIQSQIQDKKLVLLKNVESVVATKSRPVGLNTVNMLKIASRKYDIGPHDAMYIAESLYLQGFITYPRTETTKYPSEFDFKSVLEGISNTKFSKLNHYAANLLSQPISIPYKGVDSGDHPPITPTQNSPTYLNSNQSKIYELVCRNFLGSLSQDAKIENTQYTFGVSDHEFVLRKSVLQYSGYLDIVSWEQVNIYEPEIEDVKQGDEIAFESIAVLTQLTQPPSYLSESDLIGLMESNGIGTDASMSQHINNIILRKYVEVSIKDRQLIPTKLGIALIHAYKEIDHELVAPELRRRMEEQISQIAKGQMTKEQLLDTQIKIYKEKYQKFVAQSTRLDFHFDQILEFFSDYSKDYENHDDSQNNNNNNNNKQTEDSDQSKGNQYNNQYNRYQNKGYKNKQQYDGGKQHQHSTNQRNPQNQQNFRNVNNNNNNNNNQQGQFRYQRKDGGNDSQGNIQNNQQNVSNRGANMNKNNNYNQQYVVSDQQFPNIMDELNPAKFTESKDSSKQLQNDKQVDNSQSTTEQNKSQNPQKQQQNQDYKKKFNPKKQQQHYQKDKQAPVGGLGQQGSDQQNYMKASDCIEQLLENMNSIKQTKKKQKKTLQQDDENGTNQ